VSYVIFTRSNLDSNSSKSRMTFHVLWPDYARFVVIRVLWFRQKKPLC